MGVKDGKAGLAVGVKLWLGGVVCVSVASGDQVFVAVAIAV